MLPIRVDIEFKSEELERLDLDPAFDAGFQRGVIKSYRKRIQLIRAALDERDFYAMRSLHFEKLKGDLKGFYSMRLNDQWRLILKFRKVSSGKIVVVVEVADYH